MAPHILDGAPILTIWPEIPVISTELTPFIECITPLPVTGIGKCPIFGLLDIIL